MMATQDVRYVVTVDDAGALKKLQDLGLTMKEIQSGAGKADSAFTRLFSTFTLGSIAANAVNKIMSSARGFLESAIRGAIEEEQSQTRLATALRLAGNMRRDALPDLLNFAQAQAQVTLYTHEEVEASMALLESITKLDNAGLKRAMIGVEGLASTMGPEAGGLEGATRLVMKAVQGNTTALQRAGIVIDQAIPPHERLAEIIRRLTELYPRATAEVDTMGGKVKQASKAWGEFKEGLGRALLDATQAGDLLPIATKAITSMTSETKGGASELARYNQQMAAVRGWTSPFVVQTNAAALATADFTAKVKDLAASFVMDVRPAAQIVVPSIKSVGDSLAYLKAKMDAIKNEKYEVEDMFPFGDIVELDPGAVVDRIFPPEMAITLPDFLQDMMPDFTRSVAKETKKEHDYFAGLYNDIASGFGNAFEQINFTLQGFAKFFIGIWESIKLAVFRVIGEIVAEWLLATSIMRGIFGFVRSILFPLSSLMPMLGFTGGILPFQTGFHGMVTRPTLALIGEAGPERVDITPTRRGGGGGAGGVTNNFYISALDGADVERVVRQRVVPVLKEVYAHGGL